MTPVPWRASLGDAGAGVSAAIVSLAPLLTLGLLAYAPLGLRAAEFGLPAAFLTAGMGALVIALAGRSALPVGGLSSATALIYAGAVAELAADPALRLGTPGHLAALVGVASCSVLGMGLVQMLFGLLRLGSLARFVPQPVLAGFMNGVAVLILWSQVPTLLGLVGTATAPPNGQIQPATLLVGAVSAAVVWLVAWRLPRAPAALVGLGAGCALYAALRLLLPQVALGPLAGALPAALPEPSLWTPLWNGGIGAELLLRHARALGTTAVLLALIGSLETVLYMRSVDADLHTRHDPNRELVVFGAGNALVSLFGGLPLVYWRTRAMVLQQLGGRTRIAACACAVATGAMLLLGSPLIALLPLPVLAGVMVTIAIGLVDRWTRRLVLQGLAGDRSDGLWLNLAIVGVVCGVTLWLGFVAGVGVGLVLSMALLVRSMRHSLIRTQQSGAARPSRRVYPPRQEALLVEARRQVALIELEGALFFGNADRLVTAVDGLDAECRFLVLDLKRVSTIDASGAMVLSQLLAACAHRGRRLMLAGIAAGHPHARVLESLASPGTADGAALPAADWHADADHAVEAAERQLLGEAGLALGEGEVPLAQCSLFEGLDPVQSERVRAALRPRSLLDGEVLFRQSEPGDCLYVLTRGSITVLSRPTAQQPLPQRYVSISPGMMLGETAMLDGGGRTADAVADGPTVVHALHDDALAALQRDDPVTCACLYRNIGRHLSQRLRQASIAWRAAG